jgi:hypothetical protein
MLRLKILWKNISDDSGKIFEAGVQVTPYISYKNNIYISLMELSPS